MLEPKRGRTKVDLVADFPDRLRKARAAHGWSQQHLAELAGFHVSAIAHFEAPTTSAHNRTPTLANLKTLAATLNISANHLLGLPQEGASVPRLRVEP